MSPFVLVAFATLASPVEAVDLQAQIVEVRQESVFAGRLGERVRETLVVTVGGERFEVRVVGDYHTRTTRHYQRFQPGQTVRLPVSERRAADVARERIGRVR
jgi:hypothetical protein